MNTAMHWSRWGDPALEQPLAPPARSLIETFLDAGHDTVGVGMADVQLPDQGLADDLLEQLRELLGNQHVMVDDVTRIRHTRGKSTTDLLAMRAGDASEAPDAVLLPANHDEVAAIVAWCTDNRTALVPFGGGTSVVGGLAAKREGYAGVVAVDLRRLNRLEQLDRESATATLGAGLLGPEAERLLGEHGFTLGHFPQSFQYASIGGFAATRSSGQASVGYGRFDALVVGLRVATPLGTLELGSAPANAAGPDLRQLVLGSEGAFGVITAVTVRVRKVPELSVYDSWRFGSFVDGANALREVVQSGLGPTVLRLSDEAETAINLAKPAEVGAQSRGGVLLIAGYEGTSSQVTARRSAVSSVLAGLAGESLGDQDGQAWAQGRYQGPYLRDSLLDAGVLVETLETATFWSSLHRLYDDVRAAIESALADQGTPAIVLCHISHVYETGASLYFTVAAKQSEDPIVQWRKAKSAASEAIVGCGATITHHHAIGRDHLPWVAAEIGPVGVAMLRAVKQAVDPVGVLNPGILIR